MHENWLKRIQTHFQFKLHSLMTIKAEIKMDNDVFRQGSSWMMTSFGPNIHLERIRIEAIILCRLSLTVRYLKELPVSWSAASSLSHFTSREISLILLVQKSY